MLRALLFTLVFCGLDPRVASESSDSLQARLEKISDMIKGSRYSIHDLSRMAAKKAGELARFNMPFELGIDFGSRIFGGGKFGRKKCLIFDEKKYRYQKSLSDLAGIDIEVHKGNPDDLIMKLREWIRNDLNIKCEPGTQLCDLYKIFYGDFKAVMKQEGFRQKDINVMKPKEFIYYIKNWIEEGKLAAN